MTPTFTERTIASFREEFKPSSNCVKCEKLENFITQALQHMKCPIVKCEKKGDKYYCEYDATDIDVEDMRVIDEFVEKCVSKKASYKITGSGKRLDTGIRDLTLELVRNHR